MSNYTISGPYGLNGPKSAVRQHKRACDETRRRISEQVHLAALQGVLHCVSVYLRDVAKGAVGKLRKHDVVHLADVLVDVAPSGASPCEVGMLLP